MLQILIALTSTSISHDLATPVCDPYEDGIIRMSCIVEVPCIDTSISMGWSVDNCDQLTNSTDVIITKQTQSAATN